MGRSLESQGWKPTGGWIMGTWSKLPLGTVWISRHHWTHHTALVTGIDFKLELWLTLSRLRGVRCAKPGSWAGSCLLERGTFSLMSGHDTHNGYLHKSRIFCYRVAKILKLSLTLIWTPFPSLPNQWEPAHRILEYIETKLRQSCLSVRLFR